MFTFDRSSVFSSVESNGWVKSRFGWFQNFPVLRFVCVIFFDDSLRKLNFLGELFDLWWVTSARFVVSSFSFFFRNLELSKLNGEDSVPVSIRSSIHVFPPLLLLWRWCVAFAVKMVIERFSMHATILLFWQKSNLDKHRYPSAYPRRRRQRRRVASRRADGSVIGCLVAPGIIVKYQIKQNIVGGNILSTHFMVCFVSYSL